MEWSGRRHRPRRDEVCGLWWWRSWSSWPGWRSARRVMGGVAPAVTERLLVAAARVGQCRFARDVLRNCNHHCMFCGLAPRPELDKRGLLVASHIQPWRDSDDRERLDVANGLGACPSHDAAFDVGLPLVNRGLGLHPVRELDVATLATLGWRPSSAGRRWRSRCSCPKVRHPRARGTRHGVVPTWQGHGCGSPVSGRGLRPRLRST